MHFASLLVSWPSRSPSRWLECLKWPRAETLISTAAAAAAGRAGGPTDPWLAVAAAPIRLTECDVTARHSASERGAIVTAAAVFATNCLSTLYSAIRLPAILLLSGWGGAKAVDALFARSVDDRVRFVFAGIHCTSLMPSH